MLVLTRKVGERICIGNDIEIVVRRIAGNRVAIAIEAPREVPILRGELEQYANAFSEPTLSKAVASAPINSGAEPNVVVQGRIPNAVMPSMVETMVC